MHQGADNLLFGIARLQRAFYMTFYLHFSAAHGRKQHHCKQLPGPFVQACAGAKISKAQLREEPGHGLVKGFGQPGIAVFDLIPIERGLNGQSLFKALVGGCQRTLSGQGQVDFPFGKDLVHRGDGVQGLREADERRALVNCLPDLHRHTSGVQAGSHMSLQLRQGAEYGEDGDGHQLPHPVVQAAGIAHIPKDISLQDLHEFAVAALISGGVAVKQLLHLLFGSFFSVHGFFFLSGLRF